MTDEASRGETQQLHWLVRAKEHISIAIREQNAGLSDPSLADADTAASYLENYRKGPILTKESDE